MRLLTAHKSGAYCKTLTDWPPYEPLKKRPRDWARSMENLGDDWRIAWEKKTKLPALIEQLWEALIHEWRTPISLIERDTILCHSILQLFAVADAASEGVGSPHPQDQNPVDQRFQFEADRLLALNQMGSTLCNEVHPSRARVLPKMHTPRSGLTIRSLSLYLGLCSVDEVVPEWVVLGSYPERESMNLLLVPWPLRVVPSQFETAKPIKGEMRNMPADRFGFFTFRQRSGTGAVEKVKTLYDKAQIDIGPYRWSCASRTCALRGRAR